MQNSTLDQRLALGAATPQEQLAQTRYAAVMEAERQRLGLPDGKLLGSRLMSKSALFHRLLTDKPALALPAPLSYSYPWYTIVENSEAQEVEPPTAWNPAYMQRPPGSLEQVLINQHAWDVVERHDEHDLRVSQPDWYARGFVWRLWREDLSAEQCQAVMVPWHDMSISRITTEAQLHAEALHFARQWRDDLLAAQTPTEEDEAPLPPLLSNSPDGVPTVDDAILQRHIRRQGRNSTLKELSDRQAKGLPMVPGEDEVLARAAEEFSQRLGEDWFVNQGLLYRRTWLIQRLAPAALGEEHYLAL